jgi:hypothetical protein
MCSHVYIMCLLMYTFKPIHTCFYTSKYATFAHTHTHTHMLPPCASCLFLSITCLIKSCIFIIPRKACTYSYTHARVTWRPPPATSMRVSDSFSHSSAYARCVYIYLRIHIITTCSHALLCMIIAFCAAFSCRMLHVFFLAGMVGFFRHWGVIGPSLTYP